MYYDNKFSPSAEILNNYKISNNWEYFEKAYNNEILYREDLKNNIIKLVNILNKKDVIILCCEKDYNKCHRKLLAEYIKNKYNIKWLEYI